MALESLKRILVAISAPFKPVYDFFVSTLPVWLTLLGLACVVAGGLRLFNLPVEYARVFSSVGTAILGGGVLGVLLKSLQYTGVFKKELSEIIYGADDPQERKNLVKVFREELNDLIYGIKNPEDRQDIINMIRELLVQVTYDAKSLQNRRDLSEHWMRVCEMVYISRFPEISRDITRRIATEYFPDEHDFYYSEFQENVYIEFFDKQKRYIVAKETITLKIKPADKQQTVNWVFGTELDKFPDDTVTSYKLRRLRVGSPLKDYQVGDPPAPYAPQVEVTPDGRVLTATLDIRLEGADEYPVEIVHEKIYDLDLNQERGVTSSRFIKAPELHVEYPFADLEAKFIPVGTREDAYRSRALSFKAVIWNEYEGLIFPNQGYRLLLRRR